jgi:hypothetical protein
MSDTKERPSRTALLHVISNNATVAVLVGAVVTAALGYAISRSSDGGADPIPSTSIESSVPDTGSGDTSIPDTVSTSTTVTPTTVNPTTTKPAPPTTAKPVPPITTSPLGRPRVASVKAGSNAGTCGGGDLTQQLQIIWVTPPTTDVQLSLQWKGGSSTVAVTPSALSRDGSGNLRTVTGSKTFTGLAGSGALSAGNNQFTITIVVSGAGVDGVPSQ